MNRLNFLVLLIALTSNACSSLTKPEPKRHLATTFEPIVFSVIGASNEVIARAITSESSCPSIDIDHKKTTMQTRITPEQDADFAIRVCETVIPVSAKKVIVLGQTIPLPKKKLNQVTIIGDTGCRLKGKVLQDCSDPEAWPFEKISQQAAKQKTDLIIHTGDYFYREYCDANAKECQNTPLGDNWDTWYADFFKPASALLKKAPWIFIRGNHESCARGGKGFFKILNSGMGSTVCENEPAPHSIHFKNINFAVLDSSLQEINRDKLNTLATLQLKNSILLTHRPMYGTLTKQPLGPVPGIKAIINGHWHLFHVTEFKDNRATQIVVGNSGDLLEKDSYFLKEKTEFDGTEITESKLFKAFGFSTLNPSGKNWELRSHDTSGVVKYTKKLKIN